MPSSHTNEVRLGPTPHRGENRIESQNITKEIREGPNGRSREDYDVGKKGANWRIAEWRQTWSDQARSDFWKVF